MSFRDYLLLVANEEIDPVLRAKEGASDLVQETFLQRSNEYRAITVVRRVSGEVGFGAF